MAIRGPAANFFLVLIAALTKAFAIKACATASRASAASTALKKLARITALKTAYARKTQNAYASQASKALTVA